MATYILSKSVRIPAAASKATQIDRRDAELGIRWWNAMSKRARLQALLAVDPAGNCSPAEAWHAWKARTAREVALA
jgi:hypothetical protein